MRGRVPVSDLVVEFPEAKPEAPRQGAMSGSVSPQVRDRLCFIQRGPNRLHEADTLRFLLLPWAHPTTCFPVACFGGEDDR